MIDEEKIKLMSKLAIYEKNYGEIDQKIIKYYKSDYVYIQNWWTRISAVFAGLLIIGLVLFYQSSIQKVDLTVAIFNIDYKVYGIWLGSIMVILILFYSILSTYVYEKRYEKSEKRVKNYLAMIKQLDEYKPAIQQEEVEEEDYGSNLSNSRDDHRLL